MAKNKSFNNRSKDEQNEGYKTVPTGQPSGRFQTDKQVLTPDEMGVTSKSSPATASNLADTAAKELKSKIKVRPDVSIEDLGGKQVGGVPLAVDPTLCNAAGARTLSTVDDMSRTPYSPGGYRPETRYGKKRSEDLFELDNTAIEQVVPIVEDCPDLKAAPDSEVGYNGRMQFKQTRQKKNFSFTTDADDPGDEVTFPKLPQQLLNDASLDFADARLVAYTSGQVVIPYGSETIPETAGYPRVENGMVKTNYKPTSLDITVSNGHITGISINEERYDAVALPVVRDQANTHWQIDANNVAKTVIKLQKELGRETADDWSPLGYVINDPYQYNMLMHDIESTTGAIMATGYRSAVSSLAYQRNITRKDGINMQRNAIKMILEGYAGTMANNDRGNIRDLDFDHVIWNQDAYRAGSAAAIIKMFDSTGKYRTKADLLGLQRSFGLHLSQADNNINPLHCKPNFIKTLDKAHMFSTFDGQYNSFLPIVETKTLKLINPLSLNFFLKGWKNPSLLTSAERADSRRNNDTGTYSVYQYQYTDLRKNRYTTNVQHPVIEGMIRWLLNHEGAFVSTYGAGTAHIPFEFNFQAPNMLSFMLCSAAQDVAFARNITFRDVLFAGEQATYIWDDLEGLDKLNPLYSSQLRIGKYDEPLEAGKLATDAALRLFYSDHMQMTDHDSKGNVQYYLPWTFNEESLKVGEGAGEWDEDNGWFDPNRCFNASYPSIRCGVRNDFVDLVKSVEPKELYLALDRKLDILGFTTVTTEDDGSTTYAPVQDSTFNAEHTWLSVVRYDGNSDGRVVIKYNVDQAGSNVLTVKGLYCIPKEMGWIDWDYDDEKVITEVAYSSNTLSVSVTTIPYDSIDTNGSNALYYNGSMPVFLTSYRVESDSQTQNAIDRSAALTATFKRYFASWDYDTDCTFNVEFEMETGLFVTRSEQDSAEIDLPAIFALHSNSISEDVIDGTVRTMAPFIWTALQRFIMPVNVFANMQTQQVADHNYDPFETCFWFGVCGFLAADYTQMVLTRLSIIDQLGLDYTEDPYNKHSLILR